MKLLESGLIVSSGTMRSRHLIPALMSTLETVEEEGECKKIKEDYAVIFEKLEAGEDPEFGPLADECSELVNEVLWNALGSRTPPFHYFGSSEGDGACYGVWFCEEVYNEALECGDVVKVNVDEFGVGEWPKEDRDHNPEYVAQVGLNGFIELFDFKTKQRICVVS